MTAAAAPLYLSSADIARLTNVQRPVVSMWRTRSASTPTPFPASVTTEHAQERFDAVEIARWLEATGRGNNPQARDDIAAFASLDGASLSDPTVFLGLGALLCLKVITGLELGDKPSADLLDLSDAADPEDQFLFSEIEKLGARLPTLARHADQLADAAYSPRAAFETLMSQRFRAGVQDQASTAIDDIARAIAAKTAIALAAEVGSDEQRFADHTPGGSDLALALLSQNGDRPITLLSTADDSDAARLVRRRLRAHDVPRIDLPGQQSSASNTPLVHLAHFPGPGAPQMTDVEILHAVDDIALRLGDAERAVLVAPASALIDGTTHRDVEQSRADVLRTGRVRAIVRLPKGHVPTKPRQALALWVLGPDAAPAEDRRTMIADLIDTPTTPDVVDDLVMDLAAATSVQRLRHAHAFRFARPVMTRQLLTTKRSLVEVAPLRRPAPSPDGNDLERRIKRLVASLDADTDPAPRLPQPVRVIPLERENVPPADTTIDALIRARHLKTIAGNRLQADDIGNGNGADVIGPDELIGLRPLGSRRIDRLAFTAKYESGRFTEPGDIVFCTSPRLSAIIDADGGSVVAYPARVLRINAADPGGLSAEVLTADLANVPAGTRQWRRLPVRRVPPNQRQPLEDALETLRRERLATMQRLTRLDELTNLVVDGVTSGSLALPSTADTTKGNA